MKHLTFPLVALMVGACASAPPPTDKMASTEASVRTARELGADGIPTAQLHLRLADEELQKAKALSADDENEHATTMLQRASADAELALALAKEQGTQADAQRALKEAHDLEPGAAPSAPLPSQP
jgi:Flp pilus assembly protein TadD